MIGCDLVEIDRIEKAVNRHGDRFVDRILSERERAVFEERKRPMQFLAGRFAAKESISKTLKCGIVDGCTWHDIEVLPTQNGCPEVWINGRRREDIDVSITHAKMYAMAVSVMK